MHRGTGQGMGAVGVGGHRRTRPEVARAAALAVALAGGYWLLETSVHAFVLRRGTFVHDLFPRTPNELWMRALTAALLVVIGLLLLRRTRADPATEARILGRIVDTASEGVLITDAGGRIRYVNPAFTRITGYPLAEVEGKTPAVLNSGARGTEFYRSLWETITSGHVWVGTITDRRRDGSYYPATLTIAPVTARGGAITHFIGIQRDETDRAALTARLDQAAKLAQLGEVVGGVAHDFNNALTTMTALSDLASRKARGDAELEEILSGIGLAVDGAGALVRQLLTFAREGRAEAPVQALDLDAFAGRVSPVLRAVVPPGVAFDLVPPAEGTSVLADAHGLQHVLANLLLNAADAVAGRPAPRIGLSFAAPGAPAGQVWITVSDNGPGVPEDQRARIFAPYFTTKGEGRGTGLGLPSARETVRRFGGELVLEQGDGGGARFTVRLPLEGGEAP